MIHPQEEKKRWGRPAAGLKGSKKPGRKEMNQSKIECFNCGDGGHVATECPKKGRSTKVLTSQAEEDTEKACELAKVLNAAIRNK